MIKAILNGILGAIQGLINILISPINSIVSNLFPDLSSAISQFNSFVSTYIGGGLGYFASIIPPITRSILVIYLTFIIGYYTIAYSYIAITKIFHIIQKIKFW